MASSLKCYYYFIVIGLLASSLFINPALSDEETQTLIDEICRQMEEYTFCSNVFNENIKGHNADLVALTQITIEQSSSNATGTHAFIVQQLETVTDPAEKSALTTCEDAYHKVMEGFQNAALSFFQKDYQGMLAFERPTPQAQASCTTIFNTPPTPPNPIGDRNRQMRILIAMSIAAGTVLTSTS